MLMCLKQHAYHFDISKAMLKHTRTKHDICVSRANVLYELHTRKTLLPRCRRREIESTSNVIKPNFPNSFSGRRMEQFHAVGEKIRIFRRQFNTEQYYNARGWVSTLSLFAYVFLRIEYILPLASFRCEYIKDI